MRIARWTPIFESNVSGFLGDFNFHYGYVGDRNPPSGVSQGQDPLCVFGFYGNAIITDFDGGDPAPGRRVKVAVSQGVHNRRALRYVLLKSGRHDPTSLGSQSQHRRTCG